MSGLLSAIELEENRAHAADQVLGEMAASRRLDRRGEKSEEFRFLDEAVQ